MAPRRARVAHRPITDDPLPVGVVNGVTGWKAAGHGQHPSDQIGAYAGTVLTQYPTNLPGVQRHCGVEFMEQGWYFPSKSVVPNEWQTQQNASTRLVAGPQRRGQTFTGPQGPVSSIMMRQRVSAAALEHTAPGLPIQLMQPGSD